MKKNASFVLFMLAAFWLLASGCATAPSYSRLPPPEATALLIIHEQGEPSEAKAATEREEIVQYLVDRGYIATPDELLDDQAGANRIIRVVVGATGGYRISVFSQGARMRENAPGSGYILEPDYYRAAPYYYGPPEYYDPFYWPSTPVPPGHHGPSPYPHPPRLHGRDYYPPDRNTPSPPQRSEHSLHPARPAQPAPPPKPPKEQPKDSKHSKPEEPEPPGPQIPLRFP